MAFLGAALNPTSTGFWDDLYRDEGPVYFQDRTAKPDTAATVPGKHCYSASKTASNYTSPNMSKSKPTTSQPVLENMGMSNVRSEFSHGKRCFYCTVLVDLHHSCVKLTQVLIDTGAGATFISRTMVNKYNLHPFQVEPQVFRIADGSLTRYDEMVRVDLYIAGVRNQIEAYVNDSDRSTLMTVGVDVMDQFLMDLSSSVGRKREWKVTVAADITGSRRERHVVEQDHSTGPARMFRVSRTDGMAWTKRHGGTTGERKEKHRRLKEARAGLVDF
ncbi:hypothetical protein LTR36_003518 [Oleoguttula mirabilis]|uniref:Peptidase A2 domain-containing protein n=1 Tax=Oleoguttula mirabilis TaxID=1507867 RepID=A0AAV9JK10_9PEZI|nr:hypothetical protein LTR36_003518 [Oleoguttula mirabilis]